jgi:Misato Segment II tubulin-like domain
MREILHFQLGNKSNYVGTHLWNILVTKDISNGSRNILKMGTNPLTKMSFTERENLEKF